MLDRRSFLKSMGIGVAGMVFGGCKAVSGGSGGKGGRPNIIFIMTDDQGPWAFGAAPHADARTPNMDRLAKRGVLFSNAHCSAPACGPSRTSLMTGLLPSTTGAYSNAEGDWENMDQDALGNPVTLPRHFMDNGYHVMGRGKLFHRLFEEESSYKH